jgi:hypothetical protein
MLFRNIYHVLSHTRDIRMLMTPHTIRYDIPLHEKVGKLIKTVDTHGGMILIFERPLYDTLQKSSKEILHTTIRNERT